MPYRPLLGVVCALSALSLLLVPCLLAQAGFDPPLLNTPVDVSPDF